ncbi:MAG: polymer-forming cytoskeletal protein [Desulfobacterales bacterium]|nr:polymer-forming cytoskeletal protein [Desulfobacterales bacterium]
MGNKAEKFSIINEGLSIDGKVSTKGRLIIKGKVTGTLIGETVIIAEEGFVQAETRVDRITIGGVFEGEIKACDELKILSTGKCAGEVTCKNIMVEAGGLINAKLTCNKITEESKSFQSHLAESETDIP